LKNYLEILNEQQLLAVKNYEGASLIIAGAGSGKTRVLTTRIAYLIDNHVDPFSILALTFTNKAAREMRERIEQIVGSEAKNLWMGTFHSVFARILRAEAFRLGYPQNFTIYDSDDSKNVIKSVIKEENLDPKNQYKPSSIHSRISACKNNLIKPSDYENNIDLMEADKGLNRGRFIDIYKKYNDKCYKSGAMDFDDLLLNTYELLTRFPDILYKYQHRFKYVLIDEFQDTNVVQYLIIKKIAAVTRNLCVVGDDSQSIYSFRGANIRNILDFEKDFPELQVFKLEQNYRSTVNIVEASDSIITKNQNRLPKKLWTQNAAGSKISLIRADSEADESNMVAVNILELKKNHNYIFNNIAVLYRTNAQSRAFEESFRRFGIDYRLIGSISFYQRKEIKDILAYFRFCLNPADEESLKRIINLPARGIGDTSFARLIVYANDNQCTIWDIINNINAFDISGRVKTVLSEFLYLIKSFQIAISQNDAFTAASKIAKESGIIRMLHEDNSPEGIGRYDNVQNLLSAIKAYTERDIEDKSLSSFLQEVALLTDADIQDTSGDRVTLMTIHSAKGLEFKAVFVVGLEEGLFPSSMSSDTREEIEEERRLFYVALTRAMEKLFLCHADTRFLWGNLNYCEPSRFLDEIDGSYLDFGNQMRKNKIKAPEIKPKITEKKIVQPVRTPAVVDPNFKGDDINQLKSGMNILHNAFGNGKILQIEGNAENKIALIFFDKFGQKKILLKFAKIKIIE